MTPIFVKLADPSHTLPWPGSRGRFFNAAGEPVDGDDPFWIHCLADGSLVLADPPAAAPVKAAPSPVIAGFAVAAPAAVPAAAVAPAAAS